MKTLFIDTNVAIDVLAQRQPFYRDSALLFSMADNKKVKLNISALSFATINYVLSREKSAQQVRNALSKFKVLVKVTNLTDKIIELSLNDLGFKDFEDGLQYYSAVECKANIIITRNKKDFSASTLPVLTPNEFLASI